jgi:hypothetical protein
MTTIVTAKPTSKRISKVVRLNFLNPWPYFMTPWIIIGILMAATYVLGVTGLAGLSADGEIFFRPAYFLIVYLFVIANQTLYHQFPLALSYGITRKDFYRGTVVSALITSLVFAVGAMLIALIMGDVAIDEPAALSHQGLLLLWAFLSIQLLGITLTSLYLRWRAVGVGSFFIALAAFLSALPFIAGVWDAWDRIMRFFFAAEQLAIGWAIATAFTTALALAGYWLIRRAAPNQK